jgi:hypothetical protein
MLGIEMRRKEKLHDKTSREQLFNQIKKHFMPGIAFVLFFCDLIALLGLSTIAFLCCSIRHLY